MCTACTRVSVYNYIFIYIYILAFCLSIVLKVHKKTIDLSYLNNTLFYLSNRNFELNITKREYKKINKLTRKIMDPRKNKIK